MKYLPTIRDTARQILRDQFVEGRPYDFKDDELDLHIGEVLVEISQVAPHEVTVTVPSDGTAEVDISGIEGLLEIVKAEYPVGRHPPIFRDVSIFGNKARLDILTLPPLAEDIVLFCHQVHKLTGSESTLNPVTEKVLIEGVVAKSALGWVNEMRVSIGAAISTLTAMDGDLTSMVARIEQAENDLVSGRTLINKINIGMAPDSQYANYAARELSAAMGYLNKAGGYYRKLMGELSAGTSISRYQQWANTQFAIYQTNLRSIAKRRVWDFHPST